MIKSRVDRFSDRKAGHLDSPATQILSRNTTRGIKMKRIELTQGQLATVDDEDYSELNQKKWYACKWKRSYYAHAKTEIAGERILMHRVIMNAPKELQVDHADGNSLNNQKSNLRLCTKSQNCMNSQIRSDNTSGYKGVSWDEERRKWRVLIIKNGRNIRLGRFFCLIKAAKTYDVAARKYFGEFANTNFEIGE